MLVLFDIDGTLVVTGRAGIRGMNRAFEQLYGRREALDGVPIAGRTDRAIVVDVMQRIGVDPNDRAVDALRDAYIGQLRVEILRVVPGHPSMVLPGVTGLLDRLAATEGIATGLLTGNFAGGASVKLGHFSLWTRFRFGAFGDDHTDRRALVPVAVRQARNAGVADADARSVVIVGDTPLDVDCAKAHGARAIGVATGPFDRRSLEAAGADLTVDSLESPEVIKWLLEAEAES